MTDISVQSSSLLDEDRSWLASAHGTDATRTVTLDLSKFTKNTHYPAGLLRSGTALGRVSASGKYGPYDDAASDGRQVMVGHLFSTVDLQAATLPSYVGAALLEHGLVLETLLPTNHGVDANGKADVAGRIVYRDR